MIKQTLACLLGLSLSTTALAAEATNPTSTSTVAYEDIKSIPLSWSYRKGLRFGYNYVNKGADKTALNDDPRLSSPHMFAIGFEMQQTMAGGDWLDILFIQNVTISGLEQSLDDGNLIHLVTAIGWTQPAGSLSVPLHLVFIPDVNDYWRCAVTTGVNW